MTGMAGSRIEAEPIGEWARRAVCAGMDPDLFHPLSNLNSDPDVRAAKAICAVCPVERECLAYALANREYGIWGRTTKAERDRMRRRQRQAARCQ